MPSVSVYLVVMRARDAILLVLLGAVLTLSVAGYVYFEHVKNAEDQKSARIPSTSLSNKSKETAPAPNAEDSSAAEDGTELKVMGANSTQPQANKASTLPEPEDFDVYNQYANNESVLYAEIAVGSGQEAKPNDVAAVLYRGWLTDGQLFDQTKVNEEGKLVTFNFTIGGGQVIQGWEQGVAGMKIGGKRRLIIPPALGYGEAGTGPIPPNAVLVFDIELVALNP